MYIWFPFLFGAGRDVPRTGTEWDYQANEWLKPRTKPGISSKRSSPPKEPRASVLRRLTHYVLSCSMKIRNVIHRGLRRFIEDDDSSGLPAIAVPKLRKIVSFLQDMEQEAELRAVPSWKAHQLTGDRKGVWSLFVTRNWRITFRID